VGWAIAGGCTVLVGIELSSGKTVLNVCLDGVDITVQCLVALPVRRVFSARPQSCYEKKLTH
jgi:hypothetical protein